MLTLKVEVELPSGRKEVKEGEVTSEYENGLCVEGCGGLGHGE